VTPPIAEFRDRAPPFDRSLALETLEAAFGHPIKLIANPPATW